MSKKIPLYATIINGLYVRCRKDGIVNWTNTRRYTIEEFQEELQSGTDLRLVKYAGDENGTYEGPDWMAKILKGCGGKGEVKQG